MSEIWQINLWRVVDFLWTYQIISKNEEDENLIGLKTTMSFLLVQEQEGGLNCNAFAITWRQYSKKTIFLILKVVMIFYHNK